MHCAALSILCIQPSLAPTSSAVHHLVYLVLSTSGAQLKARNPARNRHLDLSLFVLHTNPSRECRYQKSREGHSHADAHGEIARAHGHDGGEWVVGVEKTTECGADDPCKLLHHRQGAVEVFVRELLKSSSMDNTTLTPCGFVPQIRQDSIIPHSRRAWLQPRKER